MRVVVIFIFALFLQSKVFSQNVGIGTETPDPTALLDISAKNKGVLVPRITTDSMNAIVTPATGLLIYNSDENKFFFYNGTEWSSIGTSPGWSLNGNAGTNPNQNFIGTTDNSSLIFKANNELAGKLDPTSRNMSLGLHALENNTGTANLALGNAALNLSNIQSQLIAIGDSALYTNGDGAFLPEHAISNIAIGTKALFFNNQGSYNTGIGNESLWSNRNGTYNVAIGNRSLYKNLDASFNTAIGNNALYSNRQGFGNTANGSNTLYSNTTGYQNLATGDRALYSNTTGYFNSAAGNNTMYSNTTGYFNSAYGSQSLYSNVDGAWNTVSGYRAMYSNTSGNNNTAIGIHSLISNLTGNFNVAIGSRALYSNLANHHIIAVGDSALYSNGMGADGDTEGSMNTAVGSAAMKENSKGYKNTAMGYQAMYKNDRGYENTALGPLALFRNTTGYLNTATGSSTLYNNTNGIRNTAYGVGAAYYNASGSFNTAIGNDAMFYNSTGNYNTIVGYGSYPTTSTTNYSGFGANVGSAGSGDNMVEIGNTSVTVIRGQVGFSTYSDARIKDNVQNDVPGLAFITKLRPVTYTLNIHKQNELMGKKDNLSWKGQYDIEKLRMSGFLAQQVEQAADASHFSFSGLIKPSGPHDLYGLRYSDFVVPLVKAVQEQQTIIEEQGKTIQQLKAEIEEIKKLLQTKHS